MMISINYPLGELHQVIVRIKFIHERLKMANFYSVQWMDNPLGHKHNIQKNSKVKETDETRLHFYTLISPAKQCISMPSGTTPLFN